MKMHSGDHYAVVELKKKNVLDDSALMDLLMETEVNHPIETRSELLCRFNGTLHCHALFLSNHDYPLAVLYFALCDDFPHNMEQIYQHTNTEPLTNPRLAVFYSLHRCQPYGDHLSRRLIYPTLEMLHTSYPNLTEIVTLSPIPGFAEWNQSKVGQQLPLVERCRKYIMDGYDGVGALDPVARIHFGNGAVLDSLVENGDTSPLGLARSLGIMASYRYDFSTDQLAANASRFYKQQLHNKSHY